MRFGVLEESIHSFIMLFRAIFLDKILLFSLWLFALDRWNNIPTDGVAGYGRAISFLSSHGEATTENFLRRSVGCCELYCVVWRHDKTKTVVLNTRTAYLVLVQYSEYRVLSLCLLEDKGDWGVAPR